MSKTTISIATRSNPKLYTSFLSWPVALEDDDEITISLWSRESGNTIFAWIFSGSSVSNSELEEDDHKGGAAWPEGKTGRTRQKTRILPLSSLTISWSFRHTNSLSIASLFKSSTSLWADSSLSVSSDIVRAYTSIWDCKAVDWASRAWFWVVNERWVVLWWELWIWVKIQLPARRSYKLEGLHWLLGSPCHVPSHPSRDP